MDVACKHCGAWVPDAVARSENKRVTCPACGQIFRLTRRQVTAQMPRVTPQPASIDLVDTPDQRCITRRWRRPPGVLMAGVTILLIVAYGFGLRRIQLGDGGQTANAAVAGVMLGVLVYLATMMCINRTVIRIDAQTLEVQHRPLPWPGRRRLPIGEISKVWCEEIEMSTGGDDHASYHYDVRVRLRSQRVLVLLRRLPEADEAHFVKEQIERALRIPGSGI